MDLIIIIALGMVAFAGGWYCKSRFGTQAAADLTAAKAAVADVKKAV